MSKVHFIIGDTSTEAVNLDQTVLVLLPGTIRPAVLPTYARQLHPGVKVLLRLGNEKNIFAAHLLPFLGSVDENILAAKRRELDSLHSQVEAFSGGIWKRASGFFTYLSSNHLIHGKLYPIMERHRRQAPLTNKDMTPLVEAIYGSLRRTAGATASHKQKIRTYIQSGEYDTQVVEWLARVLDPTFGLFLRKSALTTEIQELENQTRSRHDPTLEKDLGSALEQIKAGKPCDREILGVNVQNWLEKIVGCGVQRRFFVEIREVKEGLSRNGCLVLESLRNFKDSKEPAPKFIPLDKFSSIVSALDRALSQIVMVYANADPAMDAMYRGHVIHSGLLIRAFLGETNAIRTLYPEHVVGIPNNPGLNEALIAKARQAYEEGLMGRLCAEHYGLEEDALRDGLQRTVLALQRILPLLPFEVHRLVDALEARIQLQKMADKLQASGGLSMNHRQVQNLRANIGTQIARGQQITRSLKANFHMDPSKMFYLDDSLMDEIEVLFGHELGFLRSLLAKYIERRKTDGKSSSSPEQDDEARKL